jgi:hypothetical protein
MMKDQRDVALSELAALLGRLVQAERNYDDKTVGFEDGGVGEQIAASIERLAERDAALVGRPMASYTTSLAQLAITTRGDEHHRPIVHRQLSEHISALTRLVTTGTPNPR